MSTPTTLAHAKMLSPLRNTSVATSVEALSQEQLLHFGIDPQSEYGQALSSLTQHLYHAQVDVQQLWKVTSETLAGLSKQDKVAYFNAKKFLSFQIAKILDTLQNPFRATYQSLTKQNGSQVSKSHYPLFDNVTALFSATPVVVRTATYIYACTEWVDDAFKAKNQLIRFIRVYLIPPTYR